MKKESTKKSKILLLTLALSLTNVSSYGRGSTTNFLDLPQSLEDEPETVKGELYGPEITDCQLISGGWKNGNKPEYVEYTKREMAKAAKTFNENIPELARFLNGKKLSDFIDLSTGDITKNYITYSGNVNGISKIIIDQNFFKNLYVEADKEAGTEGTKEGCGPDSAIITESCYSGEIDHSKLTNDKYISEEDVRNIIPNLGSLISSYKRNLAEITETVAKCTALYSVVSNAATERSMNYSEYNKTQSSKSFDGKLICSSLGYETQDYKACSTASNFYDTVFLSRKAVETAQQFQYMDKSMDIQTEMAQNVQTDATAGLKAQKQDIQQKAEMARTRAATETAAVGALWAAMEEIPTLDEIGAECESNIERISKSNEIKNFEETITSYYKKTVEEKIGDTNIKEDGSKTDSLLDQALSSYLVGACEKYVINVGSSASHALIQNAGARDVIEQALIDAGVNIATMLGTAEILDKQASRVGDAIKLVDEHEPESLAYDSEDLLVTECQVNPGSENCVSAQYERGVGYHNDGISVSGMQFATSDSTLPIEETSRNSDVTSDSTDRSTSIGGIGSTIDPVDQAGGLADTPTGAASIASTGANGIGAGGGGGGSGGGGASAPANGSARTGGQGGSKPYVGSSKKLKYSSGGGGLSFSSGSTRKVASKSKSANPFSKLFGKKGTKKNDVLNFRGVASGVGSKSGSIFQMISKRYSAVSKDKRLEEYKKVNE